MAEPLRFRPTNLQRADELRALLPSVKIAENRAAIEQLIAGFERLAIQGAHLRSIRRVHAPERPGETQH